MIISIDPLLFMLTCHLYIQRNDMVCLVHLFKNFNPFFNKV